MNTTLSETNEAISVDIVLLYFRIQRRKNDKHAKEHKYHNTKLYKLFAGGEVWLLVADCRETAVRAACLTDQHPCP